VLTFESGDNRSALEGAAGGGRSLAHALATRGAGAASRLALKSRDHDVRLARAPVDDAPSHALAVRPRTAENAVMMA
jgi:hypothetical protein